MGCGGRGSVESGPGTLHRGRPVGCPGTNATTVDPPAGWRRSGVGSRAERVGVSPGSFAGCSRDSAGAFAALRRAVGNGGERLPIRHGLPVPPGPGWPVATGTGPEFGGPICSFPGVVRPAEPGSPGTRVPAHLRPWPVPGLTRRAALRWTMCGSNPIRTPWRTPRVCANPGYGAHPAGVSGGGSRREDILADYLTASRTRRRRCWNAAGISRNSGGSTSNTLTAHRVMSRKRRHRPCSTVLSPFRLRTFLPVSSKSRRYIFPPGPDIAPPASPDLHRSNSLLGAAPTRSGEHRHALGRRRLVQAPV